MPPRLRISLCPAPSPIPSTSQYICIQCRHASNAGRFSTTPAPSLASLKAAPLLTRYPPTQPPSYKPPEFRKTQLHRQYQSVLRASPLILLFQHNNLKSTEWVGIRRELATALKKVDEELAKNGNTEYIGSETKLQVVQTGIFASALKIVEFWDPKFEAMQQSTDPAGNPKAQATSKLTHGLSRKAYYVANKKQPLNHGLEPLLSGPLALLTLPAVSPAHLKAAIQILAPSAPDFPAPKRKASPGYFEPAVQAGLQKLMLLGARVEGKVFDAEGVKWVGGIEGGLDGLRAQLVAMLQGVGAGVTNALEGVGRSLYITVEGRRMMLEDEEKGDAPSSAAPEAKSEEVKP